MTDDDDDDDRNMIDCEGHGPQEATLVCKHLIEAEHGNTGLGFHWNEDEDGLVANCDACEAQVDAEGFFPDDLADDTFVIVCRLCFVELALAHDVKIEPSADGTT